MTASRSGFTLIEVIVAAAVASLVGAAVYTTLVRQQQFYALASGTLSVRARLRDAADVLTTDLRGAAVATYGLPLLTDSAIEMFTGIGSAVACDSPQLTTATVGIPPSVLESGTTLTSILSTPEAGDIAILYGSPANAPDSGRWESIPVASFASQAVATACPAATKFTTAGDAAGGRRAYAVTLAAPPGPTVRKGAPIHFLRRVRYSLYRSSDGAWYLGYRRCTVSGTPRCATIQPVSGPYNPYTPPGAGTSGLEFRYYDVAGTELSSSSSGRSVARVDIVTRGSTERSVSVSGDARSVYRDSVVVSVSPRNRLR